MPSPDPTYEVAKRCPKCDLPGQLMSISPTQRRGVVVHNIYCRNAACKWFDTNWVVQVNADGSVPPPITQQEKAFPTLAANLSQGDEYTRRIEAALARQVELEQTPGSEINNPNNPR